MAIHMKRERMAIPIFEREKRIPKHTLDTNSQTIGLRIK